MCLIQKKAPLFKAPAVIKGGQIDINFSLEQFEKKKNVLLFFYPKDFTFVCPTEILAFQDKISEFEKRNTQVIGCSTDTEETHLAWLKTTRAQGGIQGVTYPLVADSSKTIAMNYQVLGGEWDYDQKKDQNTFIGLPIAYRGSFFIDQEGYIRHLSINDLPLGRNIDELLRVIDMFNHTQQYGEVCPVNWIEGEKGIKPSSEGLKQYLKRE